MSLPATGLLKPYTLVGRKNSSETMLTSLPLPGTNSVSITVLRLLQTDQSSSSSVASVTPTHVLYTAQNAEGKTEQHSIPTNFVLWSTGIAMNPFTARVTSLLPNQVHKKAIVVDAHLRVLGAPKGEVYAIGDCATVRPCI